MLAFCFVFGGVMLFAFHKWFPVIFTPTLIALLVLVLVIVLWDVQRRIRLRAIMPARLQGKILSIAFPVQQWWNVEADETREADVLIQIAPGLQVFGYMTVPLVRAPVIQGEHPGQQLTLEYFVLTAIVQRHLIGAATLMNVLAEGVPANPIATLKRSDLVSGAYDIGIYDENDEDSGPYPPTVKELLHDLSVSSMQDSVRVIDERPS